MISPLAAWLDAKHVTQTDLASAADCDRGDVCRVVRGQLRAYGKLREYLAEKAPSVLADQDRYYEERKRKIAAILEAA